MRNYIFLLLLIIIASCVKEKDKPDLINHVLESKIEGKKLYGYGNGYQNEGVYRFNNEWSFYKSRDITIIQYTFGVGVPGVIPPNSCWSIVGDSLFIDYKFISTSTVPLYHFKIDELNDTLIKLHRKEKYNLGSLGEPIYKDSIFYLFLNTTKWK
jgi:hypothetical protein